MPPPTTLPLFALLALLLGLLVVVRVRRHRADHPAAATEAATTAPADVELAPRRARRARRSDARVPAVALPLLAVPVESAEPVPAPVATVDPVEPVADESRLVSQDELAVLRHQVEALLDTIRALQDGVRPTVPAEAVVPSEPVEITVERPAELVLVDDASADAPETLVDVRPSIALSLAPTPATPPTTPPTAPPTPPTDAYAGLSRTLAAAGHLREAVLAQWAADLHVLRPFLGTRVDDVCAGLQEVVATGAEATVRHARSVAIAFTDPAIDVASLLDDLGHLRGSATPAPTVARDHSFPADVVPDGHLDALERVLTGSAVAAGDDSLVSVELRRELAADRLMAARVAGPDWDAVATLRDVLEPHERDAFDDELARRVS